MVCVFTYAIQMVHYEYLDCISHFIRTTLVCLVELDFALQSVWQFIRTPGMCECEHRCVCVCTYVHTHTHTHTHMHTHAHTHTPHTHTHTHTHKHTHTHTCTLTHVHISSLHPSIDVSNGQHSIGFIVFLSIHMQTSFVSLIFMQNEIPYSGKYWRRF